MAATSAPPNSLFATFLTYLITHLLCEELAVIGWLIVKVLTCLSSLSLSTLVLETEWITNGLSPNAWFNPWEFYNFLP